MVYFVCEGCNETLKKNQVEKHASRCRQCHAVTCVDCSQTFYGNDFEGHVTCISEAEKYEGSLFKPKASKQSPQDAWMSIVEEAARTASKAPASIQSHLSRLCDFGNVPRNQKKFANFLKNSLRLYSDQVIDAIWKHLEDMRTKNASDSLESKEVEPVSEQPEPDPEPAATTTEPRGEFKERSKKEKKKKRSNSQEIVATQEVEDEGRLETDQTSQKARKDAKRARKEAKKQKREEDVGDDS